MPVVLWIALGGALGSVLRFGLNLWITGRTDPAFPWGTLAINILGSFAIGLIDEATQRHGRIAVPPEVRMFLMVGLCGGFTTFSSFSLQTLALIDAGQPLRAIGNVLASVALCLFAVWAGTAIPSLLGRLARS